MVTFSNPHFNYPSFIDSYNLVWFLLYILVLNSALTGPLAGGSRVFLIQLSRDARFPLWDAGVFKSYHHIDRGIYHAQTPVCMYYLQFTRLLS